MPNIMDYLEHSVKEKAADLFIVAGSPATIRAGKHFTELSKEILYPEETKSLITSIYEQAGRSMDKYLSIGDDDFSLSVKNLARFRVNTYKQRGSLAAVIRVVTFGIPDYKELGIPKDVINLDKVRSGMVLITGTAGSGKSTTQACIINYINEHRESHIVTLEDPIEYLHCNKMSIVSQREIATDTDNYLSALRSCLRQSPDVILLGEMRDAETIHTAMTASETGHLVIATLHTRGAVSTIERIIDSFPSVQQEQVRVQLSMVLQMVVSQQLIPSNAGDLVPAFEILKANSAVRNQIRDNKVQHIDNSIASGKVDGMTSMDQYLLYLYSTGTISKQTALDYAVNSDFVGRRLI